MIYTEAGLKKTQTMLVEMEQALNDLRREVKPISEQKYRIMAEGFISQIRQMREEIDEYLGIVPFADPAPNPQVPAYA
jgi:primosomal protein N''